MIQVLERRAVVSPTPTPIGETEASETLLARANRKTGSIPASLLVARVMAVTRGADWPVQREALEAVLRRVASAKKDGVRIASRPAGGVGFYRAGTGRPYELLLVSVDPPRGSCECPDFLRGSLGLCKHLLAVLDALASKPKDWETARRRQPWSGPARLTWDPVRPLRGAGDWLGQVRRTDGRSDRWFGPGGALHRTFADRPRPRLNLVRDLAREAAGTRGEPALRSLLAAERERLERVVRDAADLPKLAGALRSLELKLYPYQREGVERFLAVGRLVLADDMGLGKTAQAAAAAHALWRAGKVRRGLVVAPASLKSQWLREWQQFTDTPLEIVAGDPQERRRAFAAPKGFLITNYEALLRDLDAVQKWAPDFVILDEAQRIKNWATKTAAYVKTLRPRYRLVLTGTPMENRLEELASVVEWVDDRALEPKWRLAPWHAAEGGARNLDTLRARLAGCMLRRIRQDVLKQLPGRTDTRMPVELTPAQREEHDALNQPIARIVGIAQQRPLRQEEFLRLMTLLNTQRIICNGLAQLQFEEVWPTIAPVRKPSEAMLESLHAPKLVELRELIRSVVLEQRRKVVVFSQWRRMLRLADWAVRDVLAEDGRRSVFFTGHENQKRRTQNIVEFHDDDDARVLFATDAGGVGLNLQRAANCCVNMDMPWNPAVLEQRIGRIHRIGQKRPIDAYALVAEEGIESRILDIVGNKQALFRGLFDGSSDEIAFERSGGFISRIERIVEPVRAPRIEPAEDEPEREMESKLAAADESGDTEAAVDAATEPGRAPSAAQIEGLFTGLSVRTTPRGGVVIEATPEAAAALSALLEGVGRLLKGATRPR